MAQKSQKISRADEVRTRRKIEPVKRKPIPTSKVGANRDAESSARVVSRKTNQTVSSSARSNYTQQRRKHYVNTNTPGSEIRLPSLPKINLGWRVASGLLAALMAFGLYMLLESDMFKVSVVNLAGATRVPVEEVLNNLAVNNESITRVISQDVEAEILAKFPDLKSVSVEIAMPDSLNISVEERIPAITWVNGETESYWVDEDGFAFPIRGEASIPIRIQAEGDPPRPLGYGRAEDKPTAEQEPAEQKVQASVDAQFVRSILSLRNLVPAGTTLEYTQENGLGWLDPQGWHVYFGTDIKQIGIKLIEYDRIVKALMERNLQPILISLEFLHAPYYRMEQ